MIIVPHIQNKKYAVLGLGKSGLATAASLRQSGAQVFVWDDKEASRAEAEKSGYALCDFTTADVSEFEALLLSPGIPHTYPAPHPAVVCFRAAQVPIIGDIELLFRACPDATYIGITGTNGKSTTTALIGHILQQAGRKVQVGGNLGTPVLSFEALDKDGIYVLELSSYQLELIEHNLLNVVLLLNITADHLSRHGGMSGYVAAKKRIIRAEAPQTLILGVDEAETAALVHEASTNPQVKLVPLSVKKDMPIGIEAKAGALKINGQKILDLESLPHLPGAHNAQNIGAAFAACRAVGLQDGEIIRGLTTFPGLAHRQQCIAEINGIRFINDSKATNADAAEKALLCYKDIYWIIGGRPKEGGLQGLEHYVARIRCAFIIGTEATDDFSAWCAANNVPYIISGTLDKAVAAAADQAVRDNIKDAVVLLSPACASWDQFASFEARGDQFTACVRTLSKGDLCRH